jgi:hypothetical protein
MEVSNEHGYGSFSDSTLITDFGLKSPLSINADQDLNVNLNHCFVDTKLPTIKFYQRTKKPVRYNFILYR